MILSVMWVYLVFRFPSGLDTGKKSRCSLTVLPGANEACIYLIISFTTRCSLQFVGLNFVSVYSSLNFFFFAHLPFVVRRPLNMSNQTFSSSTGKLYKSKVCFTKHLWEHSVYWDLFDALKNQERVLSIQAAIILSQPYLEFLLVTSPTSTEKKREDMKQPSGVRKPSLARKRRRESECSVDF